MKRLTHVLAVAVAALAILAACGGKGAIGESCSTSGSTDECKDGGVCGVYSGSSNTCLKVCIDQTGCAANEACNGVSGTSIKGCQAKSK